MLAGIYVIENIINKKEYIGQGWYVNKRMFHSHRDCCALNNAIKKYGEENFIRRVILYCEIFELDYYEQKCIKVFRSHIKENGYNILPGGTINRRGMTASNETRKKMGKSQQGRKHSQETKDKISKSHMGAKNPNFWKKYSDASSKYYGISRSNKNGSQWKIQIRENEKQIFLGYYETELEAARVYDKYILKHNLPNPLNFLDYGDLKE
jgi:group I intron endonuclease